MGLDGAWKKRTASSKTDLHILEAGARMDSQMEIINTAKNCFICLCPKTFLNVFALYNPGGLRLDPVQEKSQSSMTSKHDEDSSDD